MFRWLAVIGMLHLATGNAIAGNIDFERDVRPILTRHCVRCHGEKHDEGGLRLSTKKHAFAPADSESAVINPGNAADSLLIKRITSTELGDQMPADATPLSASEIKTLRDWINQGANWPDGLDGQHWAYRKPVRPTPPDIQIADHGNAIDRFIAKRMAGAKLEPNTRAVKSKLLRRVSLTLTGLPPSMEELDRFLADESDNAYERAVDRLLASPRYGERWAQQWLDLARYADSNGFQADQLREIWAYRDWVINALNDDMPFDQFTIEQIAGDMLPNATADQRIATGFHRTVPTNVEAGVHPEENRHNQVFDRVNTTGTVFLGATIECAQCHKHPFDQWSKDDFDKIAGFFKRIKTGIAPDAFAAQSFLKTKVGVPKKLDTAALRRQMYLRVSAEGLPIPWNEVWIEPPGKKPLVARLPGGDEINLNDFDDPREPLTAWLLAKDNPYFAPSFVNRVWAHYFGVGIVEPPDDFNMANPPSNKPLLDWLSEQFVANGYDMKWLHRTIASSRTYQLSSFPTPDNKDDVQNYARYYPRRLAAEVMLDAMNDASGARNNFNHQPVGVRAVALPDDSSNVESFFLRVFGRPQMDTACECERTANADLAQSLHLINSDTMVKLISAPNGRAVTMARDKTKDDRTHITEFYLHTLSRLPTENEYKIALAHLAKKRKQSAADPKKLSADQAAREAYEDIIWVVINTKEFLFNH